MIRQHSLRSSEKELDEPNCPWISHLFVYEYEGNALGVLAQNKGTTIDPQSIIAKRWTLRHGDTLPPCLRANTAAALSVKATKKTIVRCLLMGLPWWLRQ